MTDDAALWWAVTIDSRDPDLLVEVPLPPYQDWSQSDAALASMARLLRGLHFAARAFDAQGLSWHDVLADPAGEPLVCHNDVEPSNVVS